MHVHARGPDKQPTADKKVFGDIIRRIRDKCDILIQTTNGIGVHREPATGRLVWPTDEERLGLLSIEPRQDLFSLAGGSWDFYHPEGGYLGPASFMNTEDLIRKNIRGVLATGAPIELEIVEIGFLAKLRRLADEGVFAPDDPKVWLQLSFGFGGMPATARMVVNAQDEAQRLFPKLKWEVLGAGKIQFRIGAIGMLMGCDFVRVGFEDNIYLPDGRPARHNYQLVEAIVRLAREFGREPATAGDARAALALAH